MQRAGRDRGEADAACRRSDELANCVTHGVGLAASLAGLPVLVWLAASRGEARHLAGALVFGIALVVLYAASTVYHAVRSARARRICRIVDHAAIFLLIAGTYTPFTLVTLRGARGWSLFAVVWGMAAVGIVCKLFWTERWELASTAVYVAMGWLVVVAAGPLVERLPAAGLAWIVAGGLAYTAGVAFFLLDRRRFFHAVWHLFVLAGSACHFVAVARYVVAA